MSTCFLILGCGIPRHAPVDFCKKQNRKISKEERIIDVLADISNQEDKYNQKFGKNGFHYLSWRREYLREHQEASDTRIAEGYYKAYPNCCKIGIPRYLNRKIVSDDEYDASYGLESQRYVEEVFVRRQFYSKKNMNPSDYVIRSVWPCDDKIGGI